MTVYEKLDAFLISFLFRDSFDQTAFSNERNDIFLHCQRKLTSINSSPHWAIKPSRKDPEGSNQDALFECQELECISISSPLQRETTSTLGSTRRQQHPKVCMKDVTGTRIQAISSKVLYREAPPLDSNPYPLICQFFIPKWHPCHNLEQECSPFLYTCLYLKDKPKH